MKGKNLDLKKARRNGVMKTSGRGWGENVGRVKVY
jgi:hypothetical protein